MELVEAYIGIEGFTVTVHNLEIPLMCREGRRLVITMGFPIEYLKSVHINGDIPVTTYLKNWSKGEFVIFFEENISVKEIYVKWS